MKAVTFYPRREFLYWLLLFFVANVINGFAIYHYKTSWMELLTQMGYVVMLSVIFYILLVVIRALIWLIRNRKQHAIGQTEEQTHAH
jgi:hypothetical protein